MEYRHREEGKRISTVFVGLYDIFLNFWTSLALVLTISILYMIVKVPVVKRFHSWSQNRTKRRLEENIAAHDSTTCKNNGSTFQEKT